MNLDEEKLHIKIVALRAIYKFVVDKFLTELQNIVLSSLTLKFKI